MNNIIRQVQVNIPFTMMVERYLDLFIQHEINPEIGIDATALERFSISDYSRIARMLHQKKLSITMHGPFIDLSPGSLDPAVRALTRHRFEQLLELVALFRPKSLVCHAGYDRKRYGFHRQQWIENSIEMWSWLAICAREKGARLMLENVYEDGPEDIRILFERLEPQSIGFCLDTGHSSAFGQASLAQWLESLGSYLGQVHLHDNHGGWDDHLPLGAGKIDFQYLFNFLKSNNRPQPIITLEPHEEEHLWPSLAYLEKFWPW
jgi:sugar phosphate isomerase/epimerase